MDKQYGDRFTLFPIALGEKESNSMIHAPQSNMGNSIVGQQVKDFNSQRFLDPVPIRVERLDDVLEVGGARHVSLMKLDAQGFECFIIDGMSSVLNKTHAIKAEVAFKWLNQFKGCSDTIILENYGVTILESFEIIP